MANDHAKQSSEQSIITEVSYSYTEIKMIIKREISVSGRRKEMDIRYLRLKEK